MNNVLSKELYKMWYNEDVKSKLSRKDKEEILNQISAISLEQPLYMSNIKIEHDRIPKLAECSNTKRFTGMQLYAVMIEISNELFKE